MSNFPSIQLSQELLKITQFSIIQNAIQEEQELVRQRLIEKNKMAAREQLLRIQLVLARQSC